MLFDVRVLAFDPVRAPDPADALMRAFRVERAVAEEAVSKLPRVLKRAMPLEMAQRFCEVLDAVGAQGEIVLSEQVVHPEGAPRPAASRRQPADGSQVSLRPAFRAEPGALALARGSLREPESTRGSLSTVFSLPEGPDVLVLPDVSPRFQAAQRAENSPEPEPLEADLSVARKLPAAPVARIVSHTPEPSVKGADFRPARPANLLAETMAEEPAPEPVLAPSVEVLAPEPPVDTRLPKRPPLPLSPLARLAVAGPSVARDRADLPGARALRSGLTWASVAMGLALTLISFGLLPLCLLMVWALDARRRLRLVRAMGGSALPATSAQLPDLHAWIKQFATRLELSEPPRLYVGHTPDGLCAVPRAGVLHVLVDAQFLARHVEADTTHVPSFALAHELARFALGQRRRTHALLALLWPQLARMDALCADALAVQLMADRGDAQRALLALLVGPLASELDLAELERQLGSHARKGLGYEPPLSGPRGRLMARLFHLHTSYLYTAARPSRVQR